MSAKLQTVVSHAPADRVQLTPSWVLRLVQESMRTLWGLHRWTGLGKLAWMEMGMDRIITQHFILRSHFQFPVPSDYPLKDKMKLTV